MRKKLYCIEKSNIYIYFKKESTGIHIMKLK